MRWGGAEAVGVLRRGGREGRAPCGGRGGTAFLTAGGRPFSTSDSPSRLIRTSPTLRQVTRRPDSQAPDNALLGVTGGGEM